MTTAGYVLVEAQPIFAAAHAFQRATKSPRDIDTW